MSELTTTDDRSTWAMILAAVLFSAGAVILFVRFPPADVLGWVAASLNLTVGVPLLAAAVLFGGAARLALTVRRRRPFVIAASVLAVISLVLGVVLIGTSAPTS